jgi:hypothetical protein
MFGVLGVSLCRRTSFPYQIPKFKTGLPPVLRRLFSVLAGTDSIGHLVIFQCSAASISNAEECGEQ